MVGFIKKFLNKDPEEAKYKAELKRKAREAEKMAYTKAYVKEKRKRASEKGKTDAVPFLDRVSKGLDKLSEQAGKVGGSGKKKKENDNPFGLDGWG